MIDDFDIKRVDLGTFSGIFADTTNSYKFLFFLALLDIAEGKRDEEPVPFIDLVAGMLYWAWYPHTQHRLSFGSRDQVAKVLDAFINAAGDDLQPSEARQKITQFLEDNPQLVREIARYVPSRFVRPFAGEELVSMPDWKVDRAVREKSASYLYRDRFPYAVSDKDLTFNRYWLHYMQTHCAILRSWVSWHWSRYMQKMNPFVPAIPHKLHPLLKRDAINSADRRDWKGFVENVGLRCIFSGNAIVPAEMHLDHFLPWKFVVHNELWNLIPIDRIENSVKSDKIPAMNHFLESFVRAHHQFLLYLESTRNWKRFKRRTASYVMALEMEPKALLTQNKLLRSYRKRMEPLAMIALNQGFEPYSRKKQA